MLRVAIADDENIVRMGLKTLIDWEANKFQLVGLFKNGREVIEYCLTEHIDILITDIKMPVMDGLELIRNIKKILPDISIIVLSSYDDFQLVSNSYKEGIFEYILKQFIEPENLIGVLNAIRSRAAGRHDAGIHKNRISIEEKNDLLSSLLFTDNNMEEHLPARSEMAGLKLNSKNLFCMVLKLYRVDKNNLTPYDSVYSLASNICTVISETVSRHCEMEYLVVDKSTIACILSFPSEFNPDAIYFRIGEMSDAIYGTLLAIFNIRVYIGLSSRYNMLSMLSGAYREAVEALKYSFFKPEGILFRYNTLSGSDNAQIDELKIKRNIQNALKYRDLNSLRKLIHGLFDDAAGGLFLKQDNFKDLVVKIVNEIDTCIMEANNKNIQQLLGITQSYVQTIIGCANRVILLEFVDGLLARLEYMLNVKIGELPFVIAAKEYIDKNYMNDIGLLDISRHIGINSNYLCRLFKEKTGENLSYYLSRYRIEKSIELTNDLKLTTEQIAERVGYSNTNYFIKVFKKITGKTITGFKGKPIARN